MARPATPKLPVSRTLISEVLQRVSNAKTKAAKIEILQEYKSPALTKVLLCNFAKSIKFVFPDGKTPYTALDRPKGVEHQFLFGLFSYRNLPAVPERNKKSYFRLSFLFGLFQYRNLGGERGLRFLWLPEFPTWGGDAVRSEP